MTTTAPSYGWLVSGAASLVILFTHSASAQPREFVGPGKCIDCHDHQDEKAWAETKDGDGKGKRHLKALDQLEEAKAATWAKAVGVSDVYDAKGTCVRCHGTVVRGSADFGVSCESCHGAGKDYLKPHQDKGAYQAAVALGMKDTMKKPDAWVRDCQSCHLLGANPGDAALVKAGHPAGDQFDLSTKFSSVALHWTSKYSPNQIASLARSLRRDTAGPAVVAPAPSMAAPKAAPIPVPTAAAPAVLPSTTAAPTATPAASVARPSPGPPSGTPPQPAPTPMLPSPPPQAEPLIAPPIVPSQAAGSDVAAPQSPAGMAGALQGRVVGLLEALLSRGARMPVRLVPAAPTLSYRGADAELLQLQREVIALALEALGTAPPAKTLPTPK
jgi:hypothetical protein